MSVQWLFFIYGRYDSSYGQWLYHLSSTLTSGQKHQDNAQFKTVVHAIHDWKLRARLLAPTHVIQMAQIKLAHDSFSVCAFFVYLFVFFGVDQYSYLFIYLFIS